MLSTHRADWCLSSSLLYLCQGSLPCGRHLRAPLTGNEEGSMGLMVLRVRPTPTRFPINIYYTPLDNTPMHSKPDVGWCYTFGITPRAQLLNSLLSIQLLHPSRPPVLKADVVGYIGVQSLSVGFSMDIAWYANVIYLLSFFK